MQRATHCWWHSPTWTGTTGLSERPSQQPAEVGLCTWAPGEHVLTSEHHSGATRTSGGHPLVSDLLCGHPRGHSSLGTAGETSAIISRPTACASPSACRPAFWECPPSATGCYHLLLKHHCFRNAPISFLPIFSLNLLAFPTNNQKSIGHGACIEGTTNVKQKGNDRSMYWARSLKPAVQVEFALFLVFNLFLFGHHRWQQSQDDALDTHGHFC